MIIMNKSKKVISLGSIKLLPKKNELTAEQDKYLEKDKNLAQALKKNKYLKVEKEKKEKKEKE